MRDDNDSFKKAFQHYIDEIRAAHKAQDTALELWKDDIRSHFYNLRTAVESCGMDSKLALELSKKDPAPKRERNTFLYLQYRVALAYANSIDVVQLLKGVSDPWQITQILKMLAAFDNDAFCHADELVSLCEGWWSSAR
tara:strand:- start:1473 stop:1889 length:417 start_codon:yes stop_codon:yes gene_type:complete